MVRTSPSADKHFDASTRFHLTSHRVADLKAFGQAGGRIDAGLCLKEIEEPETPSTAVIGAGCRAKPKVTPAQYEHGVN